MSNKFYVSTPIYYVNDIPHIGHAYTTVAADILARFHRLMGKEVFFLTGTDEHGQKVQKAATEHNRPPKEHADLMVQNFKKLWDKLNISHDAFIRTTDSAHIKTVQGLLQRLMGKKEIEKRSYSGWYCIPDERFWTEKDLVEGNCPDCGRPVERIQEENYFFLMSKYQERLIQYIVNKPSYILPDTRRNEVLGFLENNSLGDLCISRPKQRLSWGIPLPFDEEFVTYVWFDALVNYFSATRYLAPDSENARLGNFWWPASHHLVGKDILTTHAVYWSTMLMALDLPLPENIFAHGWWTVEGKKMSKSVGNVIDPHAIVDKYGADAFRYFLFREVPFGLDGDFSEEAFIHRINTDLANDLGNLLSRFLAMASKYREGVIQSAMNGSILKVTEELKEHCVSSIAEAISDTYWFHLRFNIILDSIWEVVRAANNYIAQTEPWKLAKDNQNALDGVLFHVWNALRVSAVLLYPFMPETADKMWNQLGLLSLAEAARESIEDSGALPPGIFTWDWRPDHPVRVAKGDQLFPRIEKGAKEKKPVGQTSLASHPERQTISPGLPKERSKYKSEPISGENRSETDNLISINHFSKVKLKIGEVLHAEVVKGSDKLIHLTVDTGEKRQLVAGIGKVYRPEDLIGKRIVVVTNLKPARLMGVESRGMLLAATDPEGRPVILMPEKDVPAGSKIK